MPRRKNKTMKGGFWDTITDMFKKKPATPIASSTTSSPSTTSSYTPTTTPTTTSYTPTTSTSTPSTTLTTSTGGRRSRTRRYRGGYTPNHSLTNLASKAAPFSGSKTAQPQVWLGGPQMRGGKSRKLRKSRRNRRHKK